jgi:hypothetical protein
MRAAWNQVKGAGLIFKLLLSQSDASPLPWKVFESLTVAATFVDGDVTVTLANKISAIPNQVLHDAHGAKRIFERKNRTRQRSRKRNLLKN